MSFKRGSLPALLLILVVYFFISYFSPKKTPQQNPPVVPSVSPTSSFTLGVQTNGSCHAAQVDPTDPQAFLPDPNCTSGVTDPSVTQENIYQTICKSGYTKTVRPSVSYTEKLKREQIAAYGYADTDMRSYEEDHLISLELGGSPSDPKNLWPEPGASINEKDRVENYLREQVCNGSMSLAEAQSEISKNWYAVFVQQHL